jgi:hypothetical protein
MVLHNVPSIDAALQTPVLTVASSSPSTYVSKPVAFYVQALDVSCNMSLLGTLTMEDNVLPQCDAQCVYNVKVGLIKSIFKVWLDNLSVDFSDASSNIRYFVFTENWTGLDLNISNALVNSGAISTVSNPSLNLTKHDFLRYLAQNLFGTFLGTDLFSNEEGLLNDIGIQSHVAWVAQMNILNQVAATSSPIVSASDPSYTKTLQTYAGLQTDPSGNKYLTNADITDNNISYQLISMINQDDPGRLAIDFSNQVVGADQIFSVPFRAGDAMYFYSNLSPAAGQHLLTGVPQIATRKYAMKLNIIADEVSPANPVPIEYVAGTVTKFAEYCIS